MVHHALSLNQDFASPISNRYVNTDVYVSKLETGAFDEEVLGNGFWRTSNPDRTTAVIPNNRANKTSLSSCPLMDPCLFVASTMRATTCAQVTVSIRESSYRERPPWVDCGRERGRGHTSVRATLNPSLLLSRGLARPRKSRRIEYETSCEFNASKPSPPSLSEPSHLDCGT